MKVIEANDDTLVFERAFVARDEDGGFVPRCFMSGIACELGTKPTTLDAGFVPCWPLESRLQDDWPVSVTLQKETADGGEYVEVLQNATGNPRAIAAVRKFLDLVESGRADVGMLL